MSTLLILLVSLCFTEFIHNILEVWGMRQKVEWLNLSLKGKKHGGWPINIDTKSKTIVLHLLILILTTGLSFLILKLLNFSEENTIILGILVLIINYVATTYKVDKFHKEIGILIKAAIKNV